MAERDKRERKDRTERRAGGGSDRSKVYWVGALVLVLAVVAIGYAVGSGDEEMATGPIEVEGLDDPQHLVAIAQGVEKGDPDAPITILEFGDYQCPGCGDFARIVEPQVDTEFVEPGRAKFIYYDFPIIQIHAHAFLAARAARCAGDQDQYWEYHHTLFGNQATWSADSNPAKLFVDYAERLGLDADAFEGCLESQRHAEVVTANMELGNQLAVGGTPTIMVSSGGMYDRVAGSNFDAIRAAVEALPEAVQDGGAPVPGEGAGAGSGG